MNKTTDDRTLVRVLTICNVMIASIAMYGCGTGSTSNNETELLLADPPMSNAPQDSATGMGTINVFSDNAGGVATTNPQADSDEDPTDDDIDESETASDDTSTPSESSDDNESMAAVNMTPTSPDGSSDTPMSMGTPPSNMATADADGCFVRDFQVARDQFMEAEDGSYTYLAFSTVLTAQNPVGNVMFIELHPERGFPMQPGVYDLAEIGQGLNECQICIITQENLNVQRRTRDHLLMAKSGQIEITALGEVGEPFQARLINVKLEEVIIERRGLLNTLYTEYVENGFVRCADGFEIDIIRQARPAKIGEAVPDFEIMNCSTGEYVGFHDYARNTGAVWIVGTAGWCGACRNLFNNGDMNARMVPSPLQFALDTPPENARVMIVMGEDSQQQEADRRECQQYARGYHQRFGQEVDVHFFVDHDGLNGFARLFGHLTTYTSADGRFGLPWNALVEGGETPIYRYADRSGQPERLGTLLERYSNQ